MDSAELSDSGTAQYDVVLLGLKSGVVMSDASRDLARALSVSGDQARQLLDAAPVVIRKSVPASDGQLYVTELSAIGLEVVLKSSKKLNSQPAFNAEPDSISTITSVDVGPSGSAIEEYARKIPPMARRPFIIKSLLYFPIFLVMVLAYVLMKGGD